MNKNRFRTPVALGAGFILLCVAPGLIRAQAASPAPMQAPNMASQAPQAKKDSAPPDDFAGLTYTDEQKAEIDKIRQDTLQRKDAVAKDDKLSADQKDAMVLGYTRLEYGRIYKILTLDQQRLVRQRIRARREADEAARKKQPPSGRNSAPPK